MTFSFLDSHQNIYCVPCREHHRSMTRNPLSCVICGCFELRNGSISLSTQSFQFSDVVVYDTVITANLGPPMKTKLFVTGRQLFPDGTIICAIAKGGPLHPLGYLMHASSIISIQSNAPLYRDLMQRSRINATGKIISPVTRIGRDNISFNLETMAHLNDSTWLWTMR